jgi:hypothetical protein
LDTGSIESQCLTQRVFNFTLVAARGHIDEVDYEQAAQIA